jgi:hypothetical protein
VLVVAGLIGAPACFSPRPPTGAPCATSAECPGEQQCVAGVCGGVVPELDAQVTADGPVVLVDAPVSTRVVIGENPAHVRDVEINPGAMTGNLNANDHISADEFDTGLVWFDLASIPAGSTITRVTLNVTTTDFAATDGGTVIVQRLREGWVETEANWLSRANGQAWGTSGARPPSRDAAAVAAFVPAALATSYDVELPAALVQDWIDDPAINFGIALSRGTTTLHVHFGVREAVGGSKLAVEYY